MAIYGLHVRKFIQDSRRQKQMTEDDEQFNGQAYCRANMYLFEFEFDFEATHMRAHTQEELIGTLCPDPG